MTGRCIICGSHDAKLWTLDNQQMAGVTFLCAEHEAPLLVILEATENLPPAEQRPLNDRPDLPEVEEEEEPAPKGRKMRQMEPLDWAPPS